MTEVLDVVKSQITKIGAIIAVFVTAQAGIVSCTNAEIDRRVRFREAVTSEEALVRNYLDQYAALAAENNAVLRERRAIALNWQLERKTPEFKEYVSWLGYDSAVMAAAHEQIEVSRRNILQAMQPEIAGKVAANAARSQASDPAAPSGPPIDVGATPPSVAQRAVLPNTDVAPAPVAADYRNLQIHAGNDRGWDFDVFWCVDGDAPTASQPNYSKARIVAEQMKEVTSATATIGRIRLRPLPRERQGVGLPALGSGLSMRADSDAAEIEVRNRLRDWLRSRNPPFFFVDGRSAQNTRFYISLFVCER